MTLTLPRMKVMLALLALAFGSLMFSSQSAHAAVATDCTRFVSTTGNDAAAGTQAAPWRTVLAAINKLTAGSVLCVLPGTYTQEVVDSSLPAGTATARITVKGYDPANRPLLDGRFSLSNLHYWTIRDLRFTNPTPITTSGAVATSITDKRIVALIGGNDVVFQGNEIFNGTYAGLLVGRSSQTSSTWPMRYTISNNRIHDTSAANFYFNPGVPSDGNLIEHNVFAHSGTENLKIGWGDNCSGYTGGTTGYGAGGVVARYNTMVDAGSGGNLIIAEPGGQHDVRAYRNLMVDKDSQRGFHVRYDNVTGCLGDRVYVTDNWAYGTKPGTSTQIPFSNDFGASPVNKSHESGNVVGQDPLLDANFVPQNPAAQGYGYTAGVTTAPASN